MDLGRIAGNGDVIVSSGRLIAVAADADSGAVVVDEGRVVAGFVVCRRALAALACELVDYVGDIGGFWAAAGGLACHVVLTGEYEGVGEREESGGREGEGGDFFVVHFITWH